MQLHENGDTETNCGVNYQNIFAPDSHWKAQTVKQRQEFALVDDVSFVALVIPTPELSIDFQCATYLALSGAILSFLKAKAKLPCTGP